MKKLFFLPLLLITCFCLAQNAKSIIGKPIQIGNLLVAQNDFPEELNWEDANKACRALGNGWRLPTKYELNILFENMDKIGGGGEFSYWSSAQYDRSYSWRQDFIYGRQFKYLKNSKCNVRAVRFL
jgi:hypothetical protein